MSMYLWVFLGGGIGAAGRYAVASQALRIAGPFFPWGTLIVNVTGSLLMGLLIGGLAHRFEIAPETRGFLVTGVLGGFTTFSAFSLDAALLFEKKAYLASGLYVAGSVGLSILALFVGLWSARAVLQ